MKNQGFIQLIVIFLLIIVILSLLGVSLSSLFQNKTLQENFSFIGVGLGYAWDQWLEKPVAAVKDVIMNGFIRELFWNPFLSFLKTGKGAENIFPK